jgi:hypothetical protein
VTTSASGGAGPWVMADLEYGIFAQNNTNLSDGTFYEGCLVSGYPSDAVENAVQANIVAAGYSK